MSFEPNARRPALYDVAIVGAGTVGLTLALALTRAGLRAVLIGPPGAKRPGRTVALLDGSVRLLQELGVWPALAVHAAPLARMRIVDATGSLFRSPPAQFDAAEIGREAFGYNVPNDVLDAQLGQWLTEAGTDWLPAAAHGFRFGPEAVDIDIAGHDPVAAKLVGAADGRHSLARKTARIGVRSRSWPQVALTGLFRHAAPHNDTSTEFHTRAGPFTLVPLPGTDAAPHRSSLVWVMSPEDAALRRAAPDGFARLVAAQADHLLGAMTLESEIGAFPIVTAVSSRLTGPRLVLTGEAAHALPPIGAQGLNLSLRDVATLVSLVRVARERDEDVGGPALLQGYAAARRGDVALRTTAVDALNGSLLAHSPLADLRRGLGLMALAGIAPLRRAVMRSGLTPGA